MAEIALRTTERRSQRGQYHFWRPVGSTIVCYSDSRIRRKQLEIYCDFPSPKKRNNPKFQNIPGWDRICEAWTPELRKVWFEADRPQSVDPHDMSDDYLAETILLAFGANEEQKRKNFIWPEVLKLHELSGGISTPKDFRDAWLQFKRPLLIPYPLGQMLMDNIFPQQVWQELIEPIGVLDDIPFAPGSDVKAYDTFLWSEHYRQIYFIIVNDDTIDEVVESWQSTETRDGDSGEILPELAREPVEIPLTILEQAPRSIIDGNEVFLISGKYYMAKVVDEGKPDQKIYIFETYDPNIKVAHTWKAQFDYIADPVISGKTMDDIADRGKVLHPRFDKPIEAAKIIQPNIAGIN